MNFLKGWTYFSGLLIVATLARPALLIIRLLLWPFKLDGRGAGPHPGFD